MSLGHLTILPFLWVVDNYRFDATQDLEGGVFDKILQLPGIEVLNTVQGQYNTKHALVFH